MPMQDSRPVFKRILLKLSGEALMGEGEYGIDTGVLVRIAGECLQIPTRQLQVHYERDLGETSKIVRRIEGGPAPSAAAATAPALAVV